MIGVVIDDRPGCNWTVLLELWIAPLPTQYFWCWQADGMVALGSMMIVSGTVFSSLICYVTCCIDLFWIYTAFICLWLSRVYFCGTVSWSCTNKKRMMYYSLLWCMECQTITIALSLPVKIYQLILWCRWVFSSWLNAVTMTFTLVEQNVHFYMLILCVTVLLSQSMVESRSQSVRLRARPNHFSLFVTE